MERSGQHHFARVFTHSTLNCPNIFMQNMSMGDVNNDGHVDPDATTICPNSASPTERCTFYP